MNILIVDDDTVVCSALKTILENSQDIHVCALGHSGKEAVLLYKKHTPDICLLDIRMSDGTGLESAEKILSYNPSAKILFLTTFSDDEYIVKALKLGAKGYLLKQDYERLLPALKAIESGQSVFGDTIMAKVPQLLSEHKGCLNFTEAGLTSKENEIVELVAEGLSNKEIADELFLREGTVRNYLSIILEKIQLRDRTQLAIFYYKNKA